LTSGTGNGRDEQNDFRVDGTLMVQHNFGILRFSGPLKERRLEVEVFGTKGNLLWKRELSR
ncbi:MAG: alkaline phosphatase family protein, partial [Bacteroidota bacterium]